MMIYIHIYIYNIPSSVFFPFSVEMVNDLRNQGFETNCTQIRFVGGSRKNIC